MVAFGIDQLLRGVPPELKRGRVGMVTSDVATTAAGGRPSRAALLESGVNLARLFGPEHGLSGSAADGDSVDDGLDPITRLPVISLYGQRVRPTRDAIEDLDAILYDIPDVGARFYTYIWTLSHVMEAAAEQGKPVWVLDRPNPIGGDLDAVEGPILDDANLSSFVGRWNIPIRYALTIAELARLWNAERHIGCDLRVVQCAGWKRSMHWPMTGLKFVPTSPNLPGYESALFYPGTCLIEGTKLSEGRGTDSPFRLIGAPWVDGDKLALALNGRKLPGVRIEPATFTPGGRKYENQRCGGVKLIATDPAIVRPVALGLFLVAELIHLHPRDFEWLPYPTAANRKGLQHFDRLVGRLDIRPALEQLPQDLPAEIAHWTAAPDWRRRAEPHLLYD